MRNLLDDWTACAGRIAKAPHVAVFANLDSALAPIASKPEQASLPANARRALRNLARKDGATAGVLSGRP